MTIALQVGAMGQLLVDGKELGAELTPYQTAVLRLIMSHSRVASYEFILSTVWGGLDAPVSNCVAVCVHGVRKKLGCHRDAILNSVGRGYYRNPSYSLVTSDPGFLTVTVDPHQIEGICTITGERPEAVVSRLCAQETRRLEASYQ